MKKKKPGDHLPKKHPRRSGSRGLTLANAGDTKKKAANDSEEEVERTEALDAVEDFDTPVRKEDQPVQGELVEMQGEPQPTVVKGRLLAQFMEPIFFRAAKTGDRMIALDMTIMLTKEHDDGEVVPRQVISAKKFVGKDSRTRVDFKVPGQIAKFYLSNDTREEELILPAAKVTNCSISVIEKKSEGKALKQIQWKFRYQVPWSREVEKFAASSYGAAFWITTKTTEEPLFDDGEEEDDKE